ncbi:MAG: hypothetical protein GY776_10575 [Alteromonas sp.]|nr:hypothetical protein [Alteromonas sp.]
MKQERHDIACLQNGLQSGDQRSIAGGIARNDCAPVEGKYHATAQAGG